MNSISSSCIGSNRRWIAGIVLASCLLLVSHRALGESHYSWVDTRDFHDAVQGGQEPDGQPVYVAAGWYQGKWIIGKGRGRECWVPWGGAERGCTRMKKLVGDDFRWVDAAGEIPGNAVYLDEFQGGPRYFVARGHFQGTWVPGKTRAGERTCWISFAGKEHIVSRFQVLVSGRSHSHHHHGDPVGDSLTVYVIPPSGITDSRVADYLRSHGMRRTRDLDDADAILAVCKRYASNNLAAQYTSVRDMEQAVDKENASWSHAPDVGLYLYERTTDDTWKRR